MSDENTVLLTLRPKSERRLRGGHLWVYSNEIDTEKTPLKGLSADTQAIIQTASGKALGVALISPEQLICARLFSRDARAIMDKSLMVHRLNIAQSLRDAWYPNHCYRWVYGDSDGLPGVVIDRFGDVVVVQISSAAMEARKQDLLDAIEHVAKPKHIVFKNDGKQRAIERLPSYVEQVRGTLTDGCAPLIENDTHLLAPVLEGQKTGWFYDHRDNRAQLNKLVGNKRVLDVFSYVGGWGVQAAKHGASEVMCVDASAPVLEWVHQNAALNDVGERVSTLEGDAFEAMRQLKAEGESFDVVIMDPPALIPRKKDIKAGLQAYHRLNKLALRLLNKDGLLVSASCSMHLSEDALQDHLRVLARELDRDLGIVYRGGQGADHPVLPAINETRYIKALFARALPTR